MLFRVITVLFVFGLLTSTAWGQESSTKSEIKQKSLLSVLESIEQLETELRKKQRFLESPDGAGRGDQLRGEIEVLSDRLSELDKNFDEIASEVDPRIFEQAQSIRPFSWAEELQELLRPLVTAVKRLTSRPREIEQLRTKISEADANLELVSRALHNVEELRDKSTPGPLQDRLNETVQIWESRRRDIATQLSIARQKLDQKLDERRNISRSIGNIFELFFRSRGKNLFIAATLSLILFLICRHIFSFIQRFRIFRSPELRFWERLLKLVSLVFSTSGAILGFLIILYLLGDWVLLIISLLFILGLAWTSRQALPRFWNHVMLLLNLGPVREGERVELYGLPWLVPSINLYTNLTNPALEGGIQRLPLDDLVGLRSRPFHSEVWFPTRKGDWILLGDGSFGEVIQQTTEVVRVRIEGGSQRIFRSSEFVNQQITLLSTGFRIKVSFGLDYETQGDITTVIPQTLKEKINAAIEKHGYHKKIEKVLVELDEAAASSLNLAVIVDFKGEAAPEFTGLRRYLQRICVDACNETGWKLPFTQLTVHMKPVDR